MKRIASGEQYRQVLAESGFVCSGGAEDVWHLPKTLGAGTVRQLTANDDFVVFRAAFTPACGIDWCWQPGQSFLLMSANGEEEANCELQAVDRVFSFYNRGEGLVETFAADVPQQFTAVLISEAYYIAYLLNRFPCLNFDAAEAKKMVESAVHQLRLLKIFAQIRQAETGQAYEDMVVKVLDAVTESSCIHVCNGKIQGRDCEMVAQARRILFDNLVDPPTIAELSRMLYINATTLKSTFKQMCNSTIYGYVKTLRMEKAFSLLREDEYTVGQIAAAVGYRNPSKFTEAFKCYYGATPKQVRRDLKNRECA